MTYLALYIASFPVANWFILHVGYGAFPKLLPVFFGIYAPSGLYIVGSAFVFRDAVQLRFGRPAGLWCVAVGGLLAFVFADRRVALASGFAAFASEFADYFVFRHLRRRGILFSIAASSLAASAIDTVLFLAIAFGSQSFFVGTVLGKAEGALMALFIIRGYAYAIALQCQA